MDPIMLYKGVFNARPWISDFQLFFPIWKTSVLQPLCYEVLCLCTRLCASPFWWPVSFPFRPGLRWDDRKPAAARASEQRVQPRALRRHPRTAQHRQLADWPSGAHRRARLRDLLGEVLPGGRPQVLSVDWVVVEIRKNLESLPHSTPNNPVTFSVNHVIIFFKWIFFTAWCFSLMLPCRRQKGKKNISVFCFLSCFVVLSF